MSKHNQVSEFSLEGRFLGFAAEDGYKLKILRLSVLSAEYRVKIPKELRPLLYRTLAPGEWVQVAGYQKVDPYKGTVKLKATRILPVAPHRVSESSSVSAPAPHTVTQPPVTQPAQLNQSSRSRTKPTAILVCQKSDCCKRGASAIVKALQTELADRGLAEQVTICGTGCMKQCKAGPNLVMPDKSRHSRIRPGEIADLLDKKGLGKSQVVAR